MKKLLTPPHEEDMQIDITPMLDVVFIMLIFFIVTASFVKEIGLDLSKPSPNQSSELSEIRPIVVEITAQDEIFIDNRRVDHRSIRPTVVRMSAEEPEAAIIVQASKSSTTKAVIQAVDGIRAALGYEGKVPTVVVKD